MYALSLTLECHINFRSNFGESQRELSNLSYTVQSPCSFDATCIVSIHNMIFLFFLPLPVCFCVLISCIVHVRLGISSALHEAGPLLMSKCTMQDKNVHKNRQVHVHVRGNMARVTVCAKLRELANIT